MTQLCINKTRIRNIKFLKDFDLNKIQIGIPVKEDEAAKVGLTNVGEVVLPSVNFGPQCKRNVCGDVRIDKTKPKVSKYVCTIWSYPFGNTNASQIPIDIYKKCFPQEKILAPNIELQLYAGRNEEQYVIANLNEEIRENYLKETINLFLEIYGICYIFDEDIYIDDTVKKRRCNWEILPPGVKPSVHVTGLSHESNEKSNSYEQYRLLQIEKYNYEQSVEGICGFTGYYAYIFENCCVLESAIYGNATYIIPKENWEILSQKTKRELLDENKVIKKIEHKANWKHYIQVAFEELNIELKKVL